MQNLESKVLEKLVEKKLSIAIAESLTAGLVSSKLAEIDGASQVLKGAIIAYQNEIKENVLKIDPKVISLHTSVSKEVALLMAENVRKLMNSNIGISTTGVAGPSNVGDKKVGTVFVAFSGEQHNICLELNLKGSRNEIRMQTCQKVFELILEKLV